MDTSIPPHLDSIAKSVDLAPRGEQLFYVRRNSTLLLLFGFVIIYGLDVYYQNVMAPRGTIYIVGFWSALYLAVILVVHYRQRKFFTIWRKNTGGITQQTIRITADGIEIEERNGARQFTPWSLLNAYHIGGREIIISSNSVMSIAITRKLLSIEENKHIEAILSRRIKKSESMPTFRKIFGR